MYHSLALSMRPSVELVKLCRLAHSDCAHLFVCVELLTHKSRLRSFLMGTRSFVVDLQFPIWLDDTVLDTIVLRVHAEIIYIANDKILAEELSDTDLAKTTKNNQKRYPSGSDFQSSIFEARQRESNIPDYFLLLASVHILPLPGLYTLV